MAIIIIRKSLIRPRGKVKRPLGRLCRRCKKNIKENLKAIRWKGRSRLLWLMVGLSVVISRHSISIKCREFSDLLCKT